MLTLLRKPKEAGHGEVFKTSQMDEESVGRRSHYWMPPSVDSGHPLSFIQQDLFSFRSTVGAASALHVQKSSAALPPRHCQIHFVTFWTWTWGRKKKGKEHEREWRVRGWDDLKKTTRPQKTFGKQRHNQRGIMPHCGGWMCMIVFAGESGRKREGEVGRMWCLNSTWLWFFKKIKLFFFCTQQDVIEVNFMTQEMASGGKNPAQRWLCVTVRESAHKHLNARVLAKCDNMLPNLSVMHHVMADSVLVLVAGYRFVCMCLFSSQFLLVVCFVLSCCLQEAAFRTAWWVSWQDPLPPSQFLLGDNRRSHRAWRCAVVGIYWGSSGLPFRKL